MREYKEFAGKTLDEAIQEAMAHFGLDRDHLEVEIVSGGSTGIFGLVGVRKALVRARQADLGRRVAHKVWEARVKYGDKRRREAGPEVGPGVGTDTGTEDTAI